MRVKRARLDGEPDSEAGPQHPGGIDAMIDPALFEPANMPPEDAMQVEPTNDTSDDVLREQDAPEPNLMKDSNQTEGLQQSKESLGSLPPDSAIVNGMTVKLEPDHVGIETTVVQQQGVDLPTNSKVTLESPSTEDKPMVQTGTPRTSMSPVQRHSSRQLKQVERYVPQDHRSPTKPLPKPASNDRRGSSATSGQTMVTSVKSRRSSSNTSGTTHQIAAIIKRAASQEVAVRPVSRDSTAESEPDADERLARELQAEEHGLRRRQSMRL
jgi:hypothetical protein